MPRYDYRCLECEEIFEVEHSINAPALEECLCKGEKFLVERLHKAVKDDDTADIIDTTDAIAAYLSVFNNNFDEKFKTAWKVVVGEPHHDFIKYKLENPDINDI